MARGPLVTVFLQGIKLLAAAAIVGALLPYFFESPFHDPVVVTYKQVTDRMPDLPPQRVHQEKPKNPRASNLEDPEKIKFVWRGTELQPKVYVPPKLPVKFWRQNNSKINFKFSINEPDLCRDKKVDFFLMVLSAPSHMENRSKTRELWARNAQFHDIASMQLVQPVFLLGKTNDSHLQSYIEAESRIYRDIIQANFTDSYYNLTYKVLSGFVWAKQFCPQAKYVHKLDDDDDRYMLRSLNIRSYLHKRKTNNTSAFREPRREVFCFRAHFRTPNARRDPKNRWHASYEMYPETFFPQMCYGNFGYVFTMDIVQEIIDMSRRTRLFWLEDAYITGILRAMVGNITMTELPKLEMTQW